MKSVTKKLDATFISEEDKRIDEILEENSV